MEEDISNKDLLKKNTYQVFLMICPAHIPFSFATHPWFVVNRKGEISRWEVLSSKLDRNLSFGYLHKDLFPYFQGIEVFHFSQKYFWKGKVLFSIEGDETSLAARMANFIEESSAKYPKAQTYSIFGPNSNTYVSWVLNHFPESPMRLPWNAFGKKVPHTKARVA